MIQVGLEDLLAQLGALHLLLFQAGGDQVINGLALPPLAQLHHLGALLIVAEVELVVGALLEGGVQDLVDDPVDGELGVNGRGLGGGGDLAQDQVLVIDVQGGVEQDVLEGVSALQLTGGVLVLLIGLGDQSQALNVDFVGAVQERLSQAVDAGEGRPIVMVHLVTQAVHLIIGLHTAGGSMNGAHSKPS